MEQDIVYDMRMDASPAGYFAYNREVFTRAGKETKFGKGHTNK